MEELKAAREETARTRQEIGAEDVKPGDVEGMREGGSSSSTAQSKAAEKRKREIEERRKMIEAKRRKLDPNFKEAPGNQGTATSAPSPANGSGADSRGPPEKVSNPSDPFSALDVRSAPSSMTTKKPTIVDPFFSQQPCFGQCLRMNPLHACLLRRPVSRPRRQSPVASAQFPPWPLSIPPSVLFSFPRHQKTDRILLPSSVLLSRRHNVRLEV